MKFLDDKDNVNLYIYIPCGAGKITLCRQKEYKTDMDNHLGGYTKMGKNFLPKYFPRYS